MQAASRTLIPAPTHSVVYRRYRSYAAARRFLGRSLSSLHNPQRAMAAAKGVGDVQNAMSTMQKVSDAQSKLGLDQDARPPMCHVILNCIVAIFIPALAHFLARPGDVKSMSFIGVSAANLFSYLALHYIPIIGPLFFALLVIYVIFVCLMSEKKQPYQKSGASGVVDLER